MNNDYKLIKEIDFEVSSICNAFCPVCPRTEDGYKTNFIERYWTLSEIQRVLDVDILTNLTGFNICGNFGDAMGNPEIVEIIKWVRLHNEKCGINIRTNGGIGNAKLYEELGKLNILLTVGIDGINEKNNLYRVGVNWKKLNQNMLSYKKHSQPHNLTIQFLLWNETIDQLLPIIEYSKSLQAGNLYLRRPFKRYDNTVVYDKKGKPTHYLTVLDYQPLNFIMETEWRLNSLDDLKEKILQIEVPDTTVLKLNIPTKTHKSQPKKEFKHIDFEFSEEEKNRLEEYKNVSCFSKNRDNPNDLKNSSFNIYVSYDMFILPCCYFPSLTDGTLYYSLNYQKEVINKMVEIGIDEFSLKNKTIKDIFNNGTLQKFIYNNLQNDKSFGFCKINCGKCKKG